MSKRKVYYVVFQDKDETVNQVKGVRVFYNEDKARDNAARWAAEKESLIFTLGSAWIE